MVAPVSGIGLGRIMADVLTPAQRRLCMSRNRHKDTSIEVRLRSALHRAGLRFRKHARFLPGTPDLVFTRARLVVFIDGDFWHGYGFRKWSAKLQPKWRDKIAANRSRDCRNFKELRKTGWLVMRVWEHEIKRDLAGAVDRVKKMWERGIRRNATTRPVSGSPHPESTV